MYKKVILILLITVGGLLAQQTPGITNNPEGSIKGRVTDLETRSPLIGANILIKGTGKGTTTNEDGEYTFHNLEAGNYVIVYSYIGYQQVTKTDIYVKPGRTTFVNAELKSSALEIEDVVVESGYFNATDNKPISTVNFSAEEIRRAPGSAGDVSRIMYGLPSLAKVNDSYNSLIVRGGSPVENSFYLDNIEIQNINHYPVQGSSDGPIGLINIDFVEDVNFYSGGFSAIYGDRLSSVMELDFREGNSEHFAPQINLSLAGFGASAEGPLGNRGSYMVSANKSYLEFVLDKSDAGGAMPSYGDAQAKVVYNLDDNNKLTLLNLLSIDHINLEYEDALDTEVTNTYGKTDGFTNTGGINWQHLWGDRGYSNLAVSHTYTKYDRDYYETKSRNHLLLNQTTENQSRIRNVNFLKLNEMNSVEFGIEGSVIYNQFDYVFEPWQDNYGNTTPRLEVDNTMETFKSALFLVHHMQLTDKLKFDFGVRGDYFEYTDALNVSPRFTFAYDINPVTTFTGSAGIFYQDLPTYILSQNDEFADLETPRSYHYILGLSRQLGESTKLSIEAYYKEYDNFPIDPTQPNIFLFDQVTQLGLFLNHDRLVDNGKGISRGVEVILQKKLAEDFYGMVAGAISKARYRDYNGEWHDRIYDNQYNVTIEGGYVPNENWEFKLRWIYAGGAPYTPFDIEASEANAKGIYDVSRTNSERLPEYHSLNIRVDRRFYFSGSNMIVYLSVWNVYGRENVAQYVWNEVKNEQAILDQWSTLPVLGIEYEF